MDTNNQKSDLNETQLNTIIDRIVNKIIEQKIMDSQTEPATNKHNDIKVFSTVNDCIIDDDKSYEHTSSDDTHTDRDIHTHTYRDIHTDTERDIHTDGDTDTLPVVKVVPLSSRTRKYYDHIHNPYTYQVDSQLFQTYERDQSKSILKQKPNNQYTQQTHIPLSAKRKFETLLESTPRKKRRIN
eukprot:TRINITY_DN12156_c0_g1_i1.p1 TRINITY_DN12156_c0_g1~~TRINITY_DN12156_c0_g1_i1.p1  ORF type:complete len:193 (+),score=32.21 TRINITY_DN12156_c0_g1_i1:29-580(+)